MTKVIEVIYENGVFKPLEKVDLPEKTKLRIRIEAVKPSGILDVVKEFRKKINLEEIREDPLRVLLEMRDRA
jgi:predicted DNA-binding antitoxin AbrB/MazE fold protein